MLLGILIVVAGGGVATAFLVAGGTRCPTCRVGKLKTTYFYSVPAATQTFAHWRCKRCNAEFRQVNGQALIPKERFEETGGVFEPLPVARLLSPKDKS